MKKAFDSKWNTGELPPPQITECFGGVLVELQKTTVETTVKTTVKTPDLIIALLREESTLSLVEVAARIGKSVRAVERAAKKLSEQNVLKYIGAQKGGHWEVLI